MKSIKEYIVESGAEVSEAKLLSSPDEIDASNPVVKKLLKACQKYGYQLQKAFASINSKGKPSGWYTIVVSGFGPGYHPEIQYNMNAKPGEMFHLRVDLKTDMPMKQAKMYSDGLANGVAMLEVLNGIDGTKLPGLL